MRVKISSIGKRGCFGFTLIELLVVLSIIGGILSVAAPLYTGALSRMRITSATNTLLSDLRQAHRTALTQSRTVEISFVLENSTYTTDGKSRRLPVQIHLYAENCGRLLDHEVVVLRFYVDRSADPFCISLIDGGKKSVLKIDKITGQIYVR